MTRKTPHDIGALIEALIALAHRDLDPTHCDVCQAEFAARRLTAALSEVAHQDGLDAHELAGLVYVWVAGRSADEGDASDSADVEAT